jgi:hypothetical protein
MYVEKNDDRQQKKNVPNFQNSIVLESNNASVGKQFLNELTELELNQNYYFCAFAIQGNDTLLFEVKTFNLTNSVIVSNNCSLQINNNQILDNSSVNILWEGYSHSLFYTIGIIKKILIKSKNNIIEFKYASSSSNGIKCSYYGYSGWNCRTYNTQSKNKIFLKSKILNNGTKISK